VDYEFELMMLDDFKIESSEDSDNDNDQKDNSLGAQLASSFIGNLKLDRIKSVLPEIPAESPYS
jgi:hypothetical protein